MPASERMLDFKAKGPKVDLLGRDINRCHPSDPVLIPRIVYPVEGQRETVPEFGPGWSPSYKIGPDGERIKLKPLTRCICGCWSGIGLHSVSEDGTVMASYFDQDQPGQRTGCGWHVFIKLADYDQGAFAAGTE